MVDLNITLTADLNEYGRDYWAQPLCNTTVHAVHTPVQYVQYRLHSTQEQTHPGSKHQDPHKHEYETKQDHRISKTLFSCIFQTDPVFADNLH